MFWITLVAIIMSIIAFKLGVLTVLAAILTLIIEAAFVGILLFAGQALWRLIRSRRSQL